MLPTTVKRLYDVSPSAGVAKLVYAPDSKSGEVHSSCRFESDLRHHNAFARKVGSESITS